VSIMDAQGTGIQTEPIQDSPMMKSYGLDLYPASTTEVLGATIEQTFSENPVSYLWRQAELESRSVYDPEDSGYNVRAYPRGGQPGPAMVRERLRAEGKMLSKDEANKQYGIPGLLTFDTPEVPLVNAQLLNIWKHEELRRDEVLRRGQGGTTETLGKYAVSFATAALDPLNIASAFVPVVGEARYAMMAARLGRPLASLLKGAAEGAVGQALLEPFTIGQRRMMQNDYGMMDALLDIGFGAALGGGLHLPGGFLKGRMEGTPFDALERAGAAPRIAEAAGPEAREVALKGAVAAVLEDRPVRVGELLAAAQPDFADRVASLQRQIRLAEGNNIAGRLDGAIAALREQLPEAAQGQQILTTIRKLEENNIGGRFNKQIDDLKREGDEFTRAMVERRGGAYGRATIGAEPATLEQRMVNGPARGADLELLKRQQEDLAKLEDAPIEGPQDAADRYTQREKLLADIGETKARLRDPLAAVEQTPPLMQRGALDLLRQDRQGSRISAATSEEANHQLQNPDLFDTSERAVVEQVTAATKKSLSTPTEQQTDADAKMIEDSIAELQRQAKAGDLEMPETVKQADEAVKQAEGWAKGFETAAMCLVKAAA